MSNTAETADTSAPESRDVVMQIDVAFGEPKPNPMFSPWQHYITKFLTFSKPVPCAHCGRKGKRHWTMLKFFRVMEEGCMTLNPSDKEYPPLTPVCTKHILWSQRHNGKAHQREATVCRDWLCGGLDRRDYAILRKRYAGEVGH